MIRIICTHCRTMLTIDDAFAGGVCRCQHCGTIQTVPSRSKQAAAAAKGTQPTPAPPAEPKQLFRQKKAGDTGGGSGTGLDELANVVASSGLTSSRLRKHAAEKKPVAKKPRPLAKGKNDAPPPPSKRPTMLIAVTGAVIVALLGVIAYLVINGAPSGTPGGSAPGSAQAPQRGGISVTPGGTATPGGPAAPQEGPSFAGVSLDEPSVIYLLDRGQATREPLGTIKEAVFRSVESLGPARKFQVIFWSEGPEQDVYPEAGMVIASKENAESCRTKLRDVFATLHPSVAPAIKRAMAQKPAAVVIISGNDFLQDDFVKAVMDAHKGAPTKIHTVGVRTGSAGEAWTALKTVAERTHGEFKEIGVEDLR